MPSAFIRSVPSPKPGDLRVSEPSVSHRTRNSAMDAARGLAVIGMVLMHLIPTEGAVSKAGKVANAIASNVSGKPASLFFVLAGMAWALQQGRTGWTSSYIAYVVKRSTALTVVGLALHLLIWPTEVLTAIGLAFPLAAIIYSRGTRTTWAALLSILLASPFLTIWLHGWIAKDWLESGEPNLTLSSCFRLIMFDGTYPLIPWIGFILVGMLIVQVMDRFMLWATASIAVAFLMLAIVSGEGQDPGGLLSIDWTPTSIPFFVTCGGFALSVLFGFSSLPGRSMDGWICRSLRCIGGMSLTHYLGHIILLILPLHHFYPDENWSTKVGASCLVFYVAFAVAFSTLWFKRFGRGPVESALARFTGSPRSAAGA